MANNAKELSDFSGFNFPLLTPISESNQTNVFLLSVILILSVLYLWRNRKINFPAGPWGYPIIGNLTLFKNKPHTRITHLEKTYGKIFSLKLGNHRAVVVSSFEGIYQGLVKNFGKFAGRPNVFSTTVLCNGMNDGGVAYSDLSTKYKMKKHFVLSSIDQICCESDNLELMISAEAENLAYVLSLQKKPCNLGIIFESTVLRIMLLLMNGKLYTPANENFLEIWRTYQMRHELALDNWCAFVPLLSKWNRHKDIEVWERAKLQYEYQRRITNRHKDCFNPLLASDIIDQMLIMLEKNEDSGLLDRDDLDSMFIEMAGSGYKTVAVTLQWLILYVASFPDVQEKVHKELMTVIGKERLPKLSDQPYLPYTCAVVMETHRLASVMPFLLPHAVTKETMFMGYTLPVDTLMLFNVWSLHHDSKHWKQPMKFNPSRFIKEGALHIPDYFFPFGDGIRGCPGESLVDIILFLFTTHFLYQLTFDLSEKCDLEGEFKGLIVSPKPYKVMTSFRSEVLMSDSLKDEVESVISDSTVFFQN